MRVVTGAMERKCSATWSQSVRNILNYPEVVFNFDFPDESTRFNELTTFVLTSIESFADKQALEVNCPHGGISCRFTRMLDIVDKSYPWKRWEIAALNLKTRVLIFPFQSGQVGPKQQQGIRDTTESASDEWKSIGRAIDGPQWRFSHELGVIGIIICSGWVVHRRVSFCLWMLKYVPDKLQCSECGCNRV